MMCCWRSRIWVSMRLRSVSTVEAFFAMPRRVSSRPASASSIYMSQSSATVAAARFAFFSSLGSVPSILAAINTCCALVRAVSGVQGAPCVPIV